MSNDKLKELNEILSAMPYGGLPSGVIPVLCEKYPGLLRNIAVRILAEPSNYNLIKVFLTTKTSIACIPEEHLDEELCLHAINNGAMLRDIPQKLHSPAVVALALAYSPVDALYCKQGAIPDGMVNQVLRVLPFAWPLLSKKQQTPERRNIFLETVLFRNITSERFDGKKYAITTEELVRVLEKRSEIPRIQNLGSCVRADNILQLLEADPRILRSMNYKQWNDCMVEILHWVIPNRLQLLHCLLPLPLPRVLEIPGVFYCSGNDKDLTEDEKVELKEAWDCVPSIIMNDPVLRSDEWLFSLACCKDPENLFTVIDNTPSGSMVSFKLVASVLSAHPKILHRLPSVYRTHRVVKLANIEFTKAYKEMKEAYGAALLTT